MAVSDYEARGNGTICSVADLAQPVSPGSQSFIVDYGSANLEADITPGMGLMVGGEFCSVKAVVGASLQVARGCADTIPKSHLAGTPMWLFEDDIGRVNREYLAGQTVGVKVLMKTATRRMGIGESPPNAVTMMGRFARPYPPGQVFVNAKPFYEQSELNPTLDVLSVIWAHRDRVMQGDQLIGHEVSDIGPEPGTTYNLTVHAADTHALLRSVTGITGTEFNYTFESAVLDMALTAGLDLDVGGYLILESERDGFVSKEQYRLNFTANAGAIATGWGYSWGYAFGG